MLARDPVEAADQARIFLKEKPLTAYYDEILLEGLRLAQADAQRGSLNEDQMRRIRDAVAELVDDLATHTDADERRTDHGRGGCSSCPTRKGPRTKVEEQELPERWRSGKPVLCIPGPSMLDEGFGGHCYAHLVEQRGSWCSRQAGGCVVNVSHLELGHGEGVFELICLCYLEAATAAQIRYAIRRIRRRIPDVSIIVASLGRPVSVEDDEASTAGVESVQDSVRATVDKIMAVALTQSGVKTSVGTPVALVS